MKINRACIEIMIKGHKINMTKEMIMYNTNKIRIISRVINHQVQLRDKMK